MSSSSLRTIVVQFLDDTSCILDNLLVSRGRILREGLYDAADTHLLQSSSTFLVYAKVADREQSDAAWRLGRSLIMGYYFKQLFKSSVSDQIFAEGV